MRFAPVLFAAALAACGEGARVEPAPPDAADPDPASPYAACEEFAAPSSAVPVHVASTVAGADLESPSACAAMDAPFGAESKGPDRVIPISGLDVG
jgi:hypothetical protein